MTDADAIRCHNCGTLYDPMLRAACPHCTSRAPLPIFPGSSLQPAPSRPPWGFQPLGIGPMPSAISNVSPSLYQEYLRQLSQAAAIAPGFLRPDSTRVLPDKERLPALEIRSLPDHPLDLPPPRLRRGAWNQIFVIVVGLTILIGALIFFGSLR